MSESDRTHADKVRTSLLLAALIVAGVVMVREGPHFDNVIDGWRFFIVAFFAGTLTGFLGWTRVSGDTPTLRFSGSHRNPWLAALILGLACAAAASYLNRTFAAPTERSLAGEIDSIAEGKGDRWHVTVKHPDGHYQRYLVPQSVALALKDEKQVRLGIARGGLGFDYIARFEPLKP